MTTVHNWPKLTSWLALTVVALSVSCGARSGETQAATATAGVAAESAGKQVVADCRGIPTDVADADLRVVPAPADLPPGLRAFSGTWEAEFPVRGAFGRTFRQVIVQSVGSSQAFIVEIFDGLVQSRQTWRVQADGSLATQDSRGTVTLKPAAANQVEEAALTADGAFAFRATLMKCISPVS